MNSREELLKKLQLCVDDPMWTDHVEMPKRLLRTVIEQLNGHAQRPLPEIETAFFNLCEALGLQATPLAYLDAAAARAALAQRPLPEQLPSESRAKLLIQQLAWYYRVNDCAELHEDDAIEVPILDLRAADEIARDLGLPDGPAVTSAGGEAPAQEPLPVAWRYELAHARFWPDDKTVGDYTDWRWTISETRPHAGDAIRNLTPLYAVTSTERSDG